jgi:Tfp pilus assembly protein PilN
MNSSIITTKLTAFASTSSIFLQRLSAPIWKILSFNLGDESIYPAKALSASLEKGDLSVVYGSRFISKIRINGTKEYPFEEGKYPQPDAVASSLSLAINDLGALGAEVSLCIPKAWTVIKTAEFPATVKENLSDVVSYELDRITPFASADAYYDFRILNEDAGKISILIVAAKTDTIRPYIDALMEEGISPGRLTVNLSGIKTLSNYIDNGTDSIFLEIKKDGYEGALFLNGSISGVITGSFTTEDDKAKTARILTEIVPHLEAVKQSGKQPQILALLKDKSSSMKELLKSQANLPVKILNDTDINIGLPEGNKEIPYAALGGTLESLWPKGKGLNLFSKGRHEKSKTPMALTIVLIISILVMWALYLVAPFRIEEQRLHQIDRQIMLRKEEVKKVEALKKEIGALDTEISTIDKFKENRPMALDILKELTSIMPKSAWLSRVRISPTIVELEGYAASATGILSKLEASKYFKKAEFSSPTFRDTRMNADRFNVKMEIEGAGKVKEASDEEE